METFTGYHSEWNLGSPGGWDYQRLTQIIGKATWQRINQIRPLNLRLDFDSPPQEHPPAADLHHHLVQMPPTGRRRSSPPQIGSHQRPELQGPAPNGLIADLNAPLGEQLLDIPKAQRKPELEPYCVTADVRRKPVTFE